MPALAAAVAASQAELGAWLEFAAGDPYTTADAEEFITGAGHRWGAGHSYAYAIILEGVQIAGCDAPRLRQ